MGIHGTNPNIFSGEFIDLTLGLADDVDTYGRREKPAWININDLIDTPREPVHNAEADIDDEMVMTAWSTPYLGADYDRDTDYHFDDFGDRPGIAVVGNGCSYLYEEYPTASTKAVNNHLLGEVIEPCRAFVGGTLTTFAQSGKLYRRDSQRKYGVRGRRIRAHELRTRTTIRLSAIL